MNVLDLFSGIGGFSLGLERAGMRTVAFCEINEYCGKVLRKHWPEVPICKNIRAMEAYRTAEGPGNGFIRARSFTWRSGEAIQRQPTVDVGRSASANGNARPRGSITAQEHNGNPQETADDPSPISFARNTDHKGTNSSGVGSGQGVLRLQQSGNGYRPHRPSIARRPDGVIEPATAVPSLSPSEVTSGQKGGLGDIGPIDVICGGFPCTDISVAGKGLGITGPQSGLWSEYARIVGEVRPKYAIVENVAALLGRGIERVLGDLAALGFDAEWHCIPASAVGAPHRRDRVWIVAYPNGSEWRSERGARDHHGSNGHAQRQQGSDRPEPSCEDVAHANGQRQQEQRGSVAGIACLAKLELSDWWLAEPDVGRVAHGVPARVDRLRALGNAVVPQIPEIIGRAIMSSAQP
jgi:DNA (cytosine-5)-methyltransferase 1